MIFSLEVEINTTKTCMASKNSKNPNYLEEEKRRVIIQADFKMHHKATEVEITWDCHKNSSLGQWNRIKTLEVNPSPTTN